MYLTPTEAQDRLQTRYSLVSSEAPLTIGDVLAASQALDELGPFEDSVDFDNLPDALLDYVALYAHMLATDELPAISSETVSGARADYASGAPRKSRNARRMDRLIAPYIRRRGTVA